MDMNSQKEIENVHWREEFHSIFFFFFLAKTQTRINLLYVEPEVLLNPPPREVAEDIHKLLELK